MVLVIDRAKCRAREGAASVELERWPLRLDTGVEKELPEVLIMVFLHDREEQPVEGRGGTVVPDVVPMVRRDVPVVGKVG